MSGDLEDFLRRAAQRRQAKTAQQQQPAPPQRREYSDRRTERVVQTEPEEILTAEIVEEEDPNSYSARLRRLEEAKQAAAKAQAEAAKKLRNVKLGRSKSSGAAVALSGNPTKDLLAMLKRSGGLQQAILLREILDRPEHRW